MYQGLQTKLVHFPTCITNNCSHKIYKNKRSGDRMKSFLKRSLENKTPIQIIYIDDKNKISQRTIKVLAITDTVIKAYCFTKHQFRTFKLSNILSADYIRRGA